MGSSLQCYIGPYLRCSNPKVDTVMKRHACGFKECKEFGKRYSVMSEQKFCKECGGPIKDDVEVTERWPQTDADDLNTEIEERLCRFNWNTDYDEDESDYWVPNAEVSRVSDRKLWLEESVGGATPIEDFQHAREIQAFKKVYVQEIERFEEAYAPGKIEVSWGILTAYW